MKKQPRFFLPPALLALVSLLCLFESSLSSTLATDRLATRWSTENGLPQSTVRALCRTGDGYLWLGTRSGLVRFDGKRFLVFNHWNSPRLPSEEILSLLPRGEKGIFVGTRRGMAVFDGENWRIPKSADADSVTLAVNELAAGTSGTVWVGTSAGLFLLDAAGNLTPFDGWPRKQAVAGLVVFSSSRVFAATGDGKIYEAEIHPRARVRQLTLVPGGVRALQAWNHHLWVAATTGLYRVNAVTGGVQPIPLPHGCPPLCLLPGTGDGLWIGTRGRGLLRLIPGKGAVSGHHALDNLAVLSLLRDDQRNLWAGTEVSGLVRLREREVRSPVGDIGPVTAVIGGDEETMYAASRRLGVIRLALRQPGVAQFRRLYPSGLSLGVEEGVSLYAGTDNEGLLHLTPAGRILSRFFADAAVVVRALLVEPSGIVWAATDMGLYRKGKGRFLQVHLPLPGSEPRALAAIITNHAGEFWVGGEAGVWHFSAGTWTLLQGGATDPLPQRVSTLFLDREGRIWAGTRGWGLFAYSRGRWKQFNESHGLADNYIMGIQQDARGYLWCGCHRGVFRIMQTDFDRLLQQQEPRLDCMTWNENEGMPASECTGEAQPSAWKSDRGWLFFTTVGGLAMLDPAMAAETPPRIPVVIEAVLANNRAVHPEQPARFRGRLKMLEFYFTCPDLAAPEKVVFRYRLRGFSEQWSVTRPGQERNVLYLNLGPGKYDFQVQARGGSGFWTPQMDRFGLVVRSGSVVPYAVLFLLLAGVTAVFVARRRTVATPSGSKYHTSGLTADVAREKLEEMLKLMKNEKPFLEADLTLGKLARRLHIHSNYLSRIINEHLNQSFNDFVNQYRIEEACRRISEPGDKEITILQIAYETGFYSKSVFNTAFKKFTGMTPSQFRRRAQSAD